MGETRLLRPNLKDTVAGEIRNRIFSGEFRPGSKIDQDRLSEELGVSRLPIREALISLGREALVENVARRGAFVAALSRRDIRDHFELYGRVSALVAERAATRLDEADLAELERINHELEASTSVEAMEELNHQFHRIINRAGGSQRLLAVVRLLAESIPTRFYEVAEDWRSEAGRHHRRILDALQSRDGERAGREVAHHLTSSADYAVRNLEQQGFWEGVDDA